MQALDLDWLRKVLDYCPATGHFTWKAPESRRVKAGQRAGSMASKGYLLLHLKRKSYQVHRLAWFYVHGEWPRHNIDHINRNPLDNRIANLRDVTQGENLRNRLPAEKTPKWATLYAPY